MKPLISVVIPVYNGERFVRKAIESVFAQTYKNYEVITIDDGSTDQTQEVLNNISDERLTIITHAVNKGGNVARNKGVNEANGDLIAFLDYDDNWVEDKLSIYYKMFDKYPDIDFAFSDFNRYIWKTQLTMALSNSQIFPFLYDEVKNCFHDGIKGFRISKERMKYLLLKGYPLFSSTLMIRKRILKEKVKWDEQLKRNQDFDFSLQCVRYTDFLYIDHCLTNIGRHDHNISKNIDKQLDGDINVIERHLEDKYYSNKEKKIFRYYRASRLCGRGYVYLHQGNKKLSRICYLKALLSGNLIIHSLLRILWSFVKR
jgi:glycosyltransferase involved in cell wall biosynthesis